jgi:tape measure domain-containing protein
MATLAADLIVRVRGDTTGLTSAMKDAENQAKGLGGFLQRSAENAVGWIAASTIIHSFAAAATFAKESVIDFNATMEQHNVALTMMLGSADKASSVLNELFRFAAETPFEIKGIVDTTRNFMALGLTMPQIRPLLTSIADGIAAFGKGEFEIDRVRIALVQMANRGKVATQEMNQLNEVGLSGMWQVLADHMGVTTAQLQKMVEKGLVPADEFFVAFVNHAKSNWAGAAAAQAQTFNGAMVTIQDNVKKAIADAFLPLFETLRDGAVRFAEFTKTEEFNNWVLMIQSGVQLVGQAMGLLGNIFATSLGFVLDVVISVGQAIYAALQYLNPFATFSPSLVSNVQSGTAIIAQSYASLSSQVVTSLGSAETAVTRFKDLAGDGIAKAMAKADAETRKTIGYLGSAAVEAYFDAMRAVSALDQQIVDLERSITNEEQALKDMKRALESLNETLDSQKNKLKELEDQFKASEDAVKAFLDAPLAGQGAFEEAMFRSEMAAKKLELSIVNMKIGGALDKAREKVDRVKDALNSARDRLDEFTDASLVGSRAYKDAQQKNKEETNKLKLELIKLKQTPPTDLREYVLWEASIANIEDQIDKLKLAGDQLDLEEQVNLGPQRYELEKLVDKTKEMTFDEAKNGILRSRKEVERYEGQLKGAESSLAKQEAILDRMERSLSKLRLQAQKAELQRWLDTEPQRRELEKLVDKTKELTFEEARAGILAELALQQELVLQIDAQKAAIADTEQAITDQNAKISEQELLLENLGLLYDSARDSAKGLRDMLKESVDAAKDLQKEADAAAKKAAAAAKGAKGAGSDRKFDMGKLPTMPGELGGPPKTGAGFKDPFETQKKQLAELGEAFNSFKERIALIQSDIRIGILKFSKDLEGPLFEIKLLMYQTFGTLDFTDTVKRGFDFMVGYIKMSVGVALEVIRGLSDGFKTMFGPIGLILVEIGNSFRGIFDEVSKILKRFGVDTSESGDIVRTVYKGIATVVGAAIGTVVALLLGLVLIISKVVEAIARFANFVADNLPKVQRFFQDLENTILQWHRNWTTAFTNAWNTVSQWITNIQNGMRQIETNIGTTFTNVYNTVTRTFMDLVTYVGDRLTDLDKNVAGVIKTVHDTVVKGFTDSYNSVQDKMREIEKVVGDTFLAVYNTVKGKLEDVTKIITTFSDDRKRDFENFKTSVTGTWDSMTSTVKTNTDTFSQNVQSAFTGMVNQVKGIVSDNPDSLVNRVKSGFEGMKTAVSQVMNDPGGFVDSVISGFSKMVTEAIKWIVPGMPDSFYEQLESGLKSALTMVKDLITGQHSFLSVARDGFKAVIDGIMNGPLRDVVDKLTKPFKDALREIEKIVRSITGERKEAEREREAADEAKRGGNEGSDQASPAQHGGPVRAGRSYIVGEAGPELFVPSTNGRIVPNHQIAASSVGSGQGGMMHLTIELDKRTIADAIMPYVAGEIRTRTGFRSSR